ncbi:Sphingosine kinase A [Zancudomyces culisetae]|uniref:Sphingosine kinase A n=1 Tax=Zancudomyces culisetae TaxID=1213189 RepID=A0A1R1PX63_ZANCU|nr:Sphingosine kinase A [Zancudomyces culisetae]|eukprot:OMH85524.1 Sphingosine kinase A [Zancudomyces culisetae]
MVADIDIESEKLKKVGKARFDLYGMLRLLRLRQYGGRIHYLPAERKKQPENGAGDAAQETRREKAEFMIGDQDEREQEEVSPEMVETSKSPTSRWKAVGASQLKQHGGGVHRPSPLGQNAIKMNEDVQEGREQDVDDAARMPSLHATNKYIEFKPLSNISVPVNRTEDLGPKWKTIEGPFVSVNAVNLPWLSNSFMVSEFASLNDGAFDLVYAKGVGKWVLMSYLIDSTRGGFMNQNGIFHEKIQALIVEPSGTRGIGTANTTNTPSSRPATAKKGNRLSKLFSRNSVASINNVQDHKSNGDAQQDSSVEGSNGSKKGLFSFDGEPSTVGALKIQVIKQPLQIITSPWFIDTKYLTSQAQARSRNRSHHKKASAANNDYSISVNKLENSFGNEESSIYGNSPSVSGIWSGDGHARGGPGASDSIFNDEFHGSSYHSNHFGHYNDSRDALINSPISRSGSYISLQ